jgi:hypothetical protein
MVGHKQGSRGIFLVISHYQCSIITILVPHSDSLMHARHELKIPPTLAFKAITIKPRELGFMTI